MIVSRLLGNFLGKEVSGRLSSLGQTDHVLGPVEDGIVLSDEDITQDPQAASSASKAGTAAIVLGLWREI